jgi:hypothetical protein
MPTIRNSTWRAMAACTACGAAISLVTLAGTASAAPAPRTAKPGTNLLSNGNFESPTPTYSGEPPTGWKLVDLGAEKKPYSASINVYDATGQYPPPKGNPNKKDDAVNDFYESGTATGIEGMGGQQTSTKFGSITQANNPQVTFADLQEDSPEAKNSAWAGTGLQITFTSGKSKTVHTLVFLNLFTAYKSKYTKKPVSTKTTKYVLGKTLTSEKWNTWAATSLNSTIKKEFGLTSYKVTTVTFVNLEDTIDSASPYANINSYVADVAINEGKA